MLCFTLPALFFLVEALAVNDGKAPRITLNDGTKMPQLGLGTFLGFDENGPIKIKGDELTNPLKWAFDAGYRLIDTAAAYQNEEQVGRGVVESGLKRDDVFIVTKLASSTQRDVIGSLRQSLKNLKTDYVDLYLIHNPVSFLSDDKTYDNVDYVDTWKAMEEAKKLGLAKSIGISNFNISQIERLLKNSQVKPAVLQVEVNLNLGQDELLEYCKSKDIAVMAYSPFGTMFDKDPSLPAPKINDPTMVAIAKKYHKTVPQIALRYLVQRGLIPIPKSVNKNRLEENIDVFDFELTQNEMDTLKKFNKNYRTVLPSFWQDHPYYPFEKTDEARPNPFLGIKKAE